MGPTALLPLRRKARWGIFCLKNPTVSAGFEPANLGSKGQYSTPRTHKPITFFICNKIVYLKGNILRSYKVIIRPCKKTDQSCIMFHCIVESYNDDLLAISQYSEDLENGHLDTGFPWFPCVYKRMLRWFPTFQVATTCFSCSPPDLNLLVTNFVFCIHVK